MILDDEQLRQLYVGIIKPFQHPDPVGFVTRAILLSGGDSGFWEDGFVGFMPVRPGDAAREVGASEVVTLSSNVSATLAMDRLNFDTYQTIDDMVLALHFPDDFEQGKRTKEQTELLEEIENSREDTLFILEPPLATVDDVIKLLKNNADAIHVSEKQKEFFDFLLTE